MKTHGEELEAEAAVDSNRSEESYTFYGAMNHALLVLGALSRRGVGAELTELERDSIDFVRHHGFLEDVRESHTIVRRMHKAMNNKKAMREYATNPKMQVGGGALTQTRRACMCPRAQRAGHYCPERPDRGCLCCDMCPEPNHPELEPEWGECGCAPGCPCHRSPPPPQESVDPVMGRTPVIQPCDTHLHQHVRREYTEKGPQR